MAKAKNIFISHAHEDDAGCDKLKDLLKKNGMEARDYSITKDKPNSAKSNDYIKSQILAPKIKQCSTLVVYMTEKIKNREWVEWEVKYAEQNGIRVIAVYAHGEQGCDIPDYIDKLADAIVGWTGSDIVNAINGDNKCTKEDGSPYGTRTIDYYDC